MNADRVRKLLSSSQHEVIREGLQVDEAAWVEIVQSLADEIAKEELNRREEYLQAIVSMQRKLLTTPSVELGALNGVLCPLGKASRTSRVYLFENHKGEDGSLYMSQRAEWCAPGIEPELENPELQNLSYDDFFPRWSQLLGSGQAIKGLVSGFPEEEREILEPQNIRSILVLPLMVGQEFTGFIGFDDCVDERVWSLLEINLLMSAASNISLVLEQRRAERALVEANTKLEHASMAKSTFLAKVSHELRTPLNAVIGYSELLLEEIDFEEAQDTTPLYRNDVTQILNSGRHLLLMVDDLLDLSRIEVDGVKLKFEEYTLPTLIDEAVAMCKHSVDQNQNRFVVDLALSFDTVVTDRKALTQIILNLLSNAFKYTHQGLVTLSVRDEDEESFVIEVQDNGEGMTEEELERVFDAFVQADDSYTRAYEGVGLGLAITRRLCEALHITLNVDSTKHQGTTFLLHVPRQPIKVSAQSSDAPLSPEDVAL